MGPAFENATPHDRPTQGTLDSLLYAEDGRIAILGVGSGVAYDYYDSMPRARGPAPWWASEEMQRLRAAAHPAGWIFASHYGSTRPTIAGTEIGDLVAGAAQLGGVITCATVRPTTALLRLEFHSVALATPATVPILWVVIAPVHRPIVLARAAAPGYGRIVRRIAEGAAGLW